MLLGIIIIVVIIVIAGWFIYPFTPMGKAAEAKEEAAKKVDGEETTKRFKEAAENGENPEMVVGFKEIEEDEFLKNESNTYVKVKAMCMDLAADGYHLLFTSVEINKKEYGPGATITVYSKDNKEQVGYITFHDNVPKDGFSFITSNSLEQVCHESQYQRYMILDLPFLEIHSRHGIDKPPEEIPDWLMICAKRLMLFSPPVKDPKWLSKYPRAKRFINPMF